MGQIFEAVVDYLNEDNWKFNVVKEDTALVLNFRGRSGSWQCFANTDEERQWFSFYSLLPSNVPEEKRAHLAEFITRANYGLVIGNFEMDFNDGEIRYKTSIDVEGGDLTPKMIENLIQANLMTMDRYFRGFMEVMYGDQNPEDALAKVEKKREEADEEEVDDFRAQRTTEDLDDNNLSEDKEEDSSQ
jgi:hypothetical protein